MSETPRTDRARLDEHDPAVAVASECSKLERELNAAQQRIKRLEAAGDEMCSEFKAFCPLGSKTRDKWRKAKEAKL